MIYQKQTIYINGKKATDSPAVASVKSTCSLSAYVDCPYSPTCIMPTLTKIVLPSTGVSKYESLYEIFGATGIFGYQICNKKINMTLDVEGITGIANNQLYGLAINYQSADGNKSRADVIVEVENEVGDYI